MRKLLLSFTFLLNILWNAASAQSNAVASTKKNPLEEIGRKSENGWIYFKSGLKDRPEIILDKHKQAFGLSTEDAMQLMSTEKDELGMVRYRFNQYHRGYKVEGAEYSVYAQGSGSSQLFPQFALGKIVKKLNINENSLVPEQVALQAALRQIDAKRYIWQDTAYENDLKRLRRTKDVTYYPKGELVLTWLPGANDTIAQNYKLCYRFEIQTLEPFDKFEIYMDAVSGKFIKKNTLIRSCSNGTVSTIYNGQQQFTTHHRGWPNYDYVLRDECRNDIETRFYNGWSWGTKSAIRDNDNNWNDNNERRAASSHWAAQKAFDYFLGAHNRRGTDRTRKIALRIHADSYTTQYVPDNYDYDELHIGYASNGASYATLDAVGHEYTHAMTWRSARLVYERESGALDESFSDIFGLMVERHGRGGQFNWTIGEEAELIRRMDFPHLENHPDTYEGLNWHSQNDPRDFFGVHTNSGVQNKWFYLLSVGGWHNGVQVHGIGVDKAAKIAFRNLTTYLHGTSNYQAARAGAIQAAIDLYGPCSNEVVQTTNAWAAVGLGATATQGLCISPIAGVTELCAENGGSTYLVYSVSTSPGATVSWNLHHSGFEWYQNGNQLIVTRTPTYGNSSAYITATATDGVGTRSSSLSVNVMYCYSDPNMPCPPDQLCQTKVAYSKNAADDSQLAKPAVYPNPADKIVTVEVPIESTLESVTLRDITGKTIREIKFGKLHRAEIDLLHLKSGTYIVEISSSQGKFIERLVVTN